MSNVSTFEVVMVHVFHLRCGASCAPNYIEGSRLENGCSHGRHVGRETTRAFYVRGSGNGALEVRHCQH